MTATILLVEDDPSLKLVLSRALTEAGYRVRATESLDTCLKWCGDGLGDALVLDVFVGGRNSIEAAGEIVRRRPNAPILFTSAQSTLDTAIAAAAAPNADYLPKPFDLDVFLDRLARLLAAQKPKPAVLGPRRPSESAALTGRSPAMQEVFARLTKLAASDAPALIYGAAGTGKSRAALALHALRGGGEDDVFFLHFPLHPRDVEINAVIARAESRPESVWTAILEDIDQARAEEVSLVCGLAHRVRRRQSGRLRLIGTAIDPRADGVRMLGDAAPILVAMPALAARAEDVDELADRHLSALSTQWGQRFRLEASARQRLKSVDFSDNIRGLFAVLTEAAFLAPTGAIGEAMIAQALDMRRAPAPNHPPAEDMALAPTSLEAAAREAVIAALRASRGNQTRAAAALGVNRNTLRQKILQFGIDLNKIQ